MYLPLLAAILLVSYGQTLVLRSQPLSCGPCCLQKKEAGYARPATPFFRTGLYRFQYKLKLYSPAQLKSDLAMLDYSQFFMVPPFLRPLL